MSAPSRRSAPARPAAGATRQQPALNGNAPKWRSVAAVTRAVVACEACPRLRSHCESVAREKRRAYRDETYWGKPVPAFGDPAARLVVVGLAPGAHGANRTGRMFTGDSSGDWLYEALHRHGFAALPTSASRDDGQQLRDCWITAAGRCAPPDNKPLPRELERCRPYAALCHARPAAAVWLNHDGTCAVTRDAAGQVFVWDVPDAPPTLSPARSL